MESRRDGRQVQSVLKGLSDGQSTGFMVQMMDQYQTANAATIILQLIVFMLVNSVVLPETIAVLAGITVWCGGFLRLVSVRNLWRWVQ